MKKKIVIGIGVLGLVLVLFITLSHFALPKNHGVVDYKLFLSSQEKRPCFVAFGGSEGGMVYAGKETQDLRDSILALGYHFLAVGYFGTPNTPKELDRISLDAIYDTIKSVSRQPRVDQGRIALFGGSRGGELVLNLASRFNEIDAVIAIVPPNVSLPSRYGWGETSSWTFKQEEIPWISASDESLKRINKGDFFGGFSRMIKNQKAGIESEIKVERINAPILFISATQDEVWPSTLMCNRMVERLKGQNFEHYYKHIELNGGHTEFTKNYRPILEFLKQHFPIKNR